MFADGIMDLRCFLSGLASFGGLVEEEVLGGRHQSQSMLHLPLLRSKKVGDPVLESQVPATITGNASLQLRQMLLLFRHLRNLHGKQD